MKRRRTKREGRSVKSFSAAIETPKIQMIIDDEVRSQVKTKVDDQKSKDLGAKLRKFENEQKQISDAVILSSVVRSSSGYGSALSDPEQT
jgi:hypothetical protein